MVYFKFSIKKVIELDKCTNKNGWFYVVLGFPCWVVVPFVDRENQELAPAACQWEQQALEGAARVQDGTNLRNSKPLTARENLKEPRSAPATCLCFLPPPTDMKKKSTGGPTTRMTSSSWRRWGMEVSQGGPWAQEAEQGEEFLWDAVWLRNRQGDLGGRLVECAAQMLRPLHRRGESESDANINR